MTFCTLVSACVTKIKKYLIKQLKIFPHENMDAAVRPDIQIMSWYSDYGKKPPKPAGSFQLASKHFLALWRGITQELTVSEEL